VAATSVTVLISGESGTGKELVARAIHAESDRRNAPWVSLNCPVLSAHLMESELFGHQRGAFTGADAPRVGRFELANGGTICWMKSPRSISRYRRNCWRVLQEKSFERVGSSETIHVDVARVGDHQPRFGERGGGGPVPAGPLLSPGRRAGLGSAVARSPRRHSGIDRSLPCLLRRQAGREPARLDGSARDLLASYSWPGNVRELENVVTRISVLGTGAPVTAGDLERWLVDGRPAGRVDDGVISDTLPVGLSIEEMERRLIEATLEQFGGHREKTAKALGIGVRTLCGKLRQYGYAPRTKMFSKAG